jgi:hypothetical protein
MPAFDEHEPAVIRAARNSARFDKITATKSRVAALVEALDLDPAFERELVASGDSAPVVAAIAASANDSDGERSRADLQLRLDRGFVDAASHARVAAKEIRPLLEEAQVKLCDAAFASGPAQVRRLTNEAHDLTVRAAALVQAYPAPLRIDGLADALYGVGIQYALFLALYGSLERFDAVLCKAQARLMAATTPTLAKADGP